MDRRTANQWAFLGAALMDPDGARDYVTRMVPAMFEDGVCHDIFAAIQQLIYSGSPVDVITVINTAANGRPADDMKVAVMQMAETCPASPTSAAMPRRFWRITGTRCCRQI